MVSIIIMIVIIMATQLDPHGWGKAQLWNLLKPFIPIFTSVHNDAFFSTPNWVLKSYVSRESKTAIGELKGYFSPLTFLCLCLPLNHKVYRLPSFIYCSCSCLTTPQRKYQGEYHAPYRRNYSGNDATLI